MILVRAKLHHAIAAPTDSKGSPAMKMNRGMSIKLAHVGSWHSFPLAFRSCLRLLVGRTCRADTDMFTRENDPEETHGLVAHGE